MDNPAPDRRKWSTTPRRLSEFIGELLRMGISPGPVRGLQRAFRERGLYPARDLPQFCVPEPPDVFFSYHSIQNAVEIQEIAWQAMDFSARQLSEHRPDLADADFEPMISDGVRIWVDFLFIDQSARDLRTELEVLPWLLDHASAHFVLGTQPLMRAWCCYELALFNRRLATADPSASALAGPLLRSFVAPTNSFYLGWDGTETSEAPDKTYIAEQIAATFPGGFAGFDHVMAQANSVATMAFADGTAWTTPAATASLAEAAGAWWARCSGASPAPGSDGPRS